MKRSSILLSILAVGFALAAVYAGVVAYQQGQRATVAEQANAGLAGTATSAAISVQATVAAQQAAAQSAAIQAAATQSALAMTAADQSARAEALALRAESQRLAYLAANVPASSPALAQILSIEALSIDDTVEARQALWQSVLAHPDWLSRLGPDIYDFAYSAAGDLLVTTHAGGAVRVWDVRDPRAPRLVGEGAEPELGATLGVLISADSARLYVADYDDHLTVWNLANPATPARLGPILSVAELNVMALAPSGRLLATGHSTGEVRFWDLTQGDVPVPSGAPLQAHPSPIDGLAYRADGAVLATSGGPGDRFALWDVQDPTTPVALSEPDFDGQGDQWTGALSFSPSGDQLTVIRSETVMVWDVARPDAPRLTGEWTVRDNVVYDLAYSPDGRRLAVARADGSITFLGFGLAGDLQVQATAADPEGAVYALAYSPLGVAMTTVNGAGQVALLSAAPVGPVAGIGQVLAGVTEVPSFARYSSAGKLLVVEQVGGLELWDLSLPASPVRAASALTTGSLIMTAEFAPDGNWLAAADYAGDIAIWDLHDARSPKLFGSIVAGHAVSVWSLAVSPNGAYLATGDQDGVVKLWDVSDPAAPRLVSEPTSDNGGVHALTFSADSGRLLAASWDRRIHVWDLTDPSVPMLWGLPIGDSVQSMAYDPERNLLITGDDEGRLSFWDLNDSGGAVTLGAPMPALAESVTDLTLMPGSPVLAVGDDVLGEVQLWDISDARQPIPFAALPLPAAAFRGFTARPDGDVLALWGFELPLTMIDVGADALTVRACQLAGRNLTGDEWRRYFGEQPYRATCAGWPSGAASAPAP